MFLKSRPRARLSSSLYYGSRRKFFWFPVNIFARGIPIRLKFSGYVQNDPPLCKVKKIFKIFIDNFVKFMLKVEKCHFFAIFGGFQSGSFKLYGLKTWFFLSLCVLLCRWAIWKPFCCILSTSIWNCGWNRKKLVKIENGHFSIIQSKFCQIHNF